MKSKNPLSSPSIVKAGHPLLREKSRALPASFFGSDRPRRLLEEMVAVMREAGGVGLAANQIGRRERVLVMECRGNRRYPRAPSFPLQAYLNARILRRSKALEKGWEGCLSIPGFRGLVPRAHKVTFEALTPDGRKVVKTLEGFEARVMQHEVDHLDGVLYVDRMRDWKHWMHLEEFNRRRKAAAGSRDGG